RQAGDQGAEGWRWRLGPDPDASQPAGQRGRRQGAGRVDPGAEVISRTGPAWQARNRKADTVSAFFVCRTGRARLNAAGTPWTVAAATNAPRLRVPGGRSSSPA